MKYDKNKANILGGNYFSYLFLFSKENFLAYEAKQNLVYSKQEQIVLNANWGSVPRAQKREDQRAAGSPAASTQLALCLRLALI